MIGASRKGETDARSRFGARGGFLSGSLDRVARLRAKALLNGARLFDRRERLGAGHRAPEQASAAVDELERGERVDLSLEKPGRRRYRRRVHQRSVCEAGVRN